MYQGRSIAGRPVVLETTPGRILTVRKLHLICNAHLDPYWQWDWDEGAAATISTFRTAADLCEEFDTYIFNHNEVILYRWIEEYEPQLFKRIQELVKTGQWHIMGGWYLQPDCNMPSGESFIRQILLGRNYFQEKFGKAPTTAINFDPFGHTRGLVQILKKSGYDSYLFCRPNQEDCALPSDDFVWLGFDGSVITGHRASSFYNSPLGKAREKVERWMKDNPDKAEGIVLWGMGNHGGGPSRQDLKMLRDLQSSNRDWDIIHSTPEAYFKELSDANRPLPTHAEDLNPWGVGCYTSMSRVKQKHRQLENELYLVEKMASTAALQGLMHYPAEDFEEVMRDLATAEFHDNLPGSSIQPVEESILRLLYHGLEILSRLKTRAFFSLCSGQTKASGDRIPVMIYNPHPFPVRGVFQCEFQLADAIFDEQFTVPIIYQDGKPIPTQPEKEYSSIPIDWRKRCIFSAELAPGQVTRFDSDFEVLEKRPEMRQETENGAFVVRGEVMEVHINATTGLIDKYSVHGKEYLKSGAGAALVMRDNEDPWGMLVDSYRDLEGAFTLMSPEESARFSAVKADSLPAVRIIEDGPVRTVIESVFAYKQSSLVQTYRIPKHSTEIEIEVRVHWNEKDRMLKWALPTTLGKGDVLGQQAFGIQHFPNNGRECAAHKWMAMVAEDESSGLTCINDGVYGFDGCDGELRMSLLRSPAYCAHPWGDREILPQDRYNPRIDQGERLFTFWVNAGEWESRLEQIDREAIAHNEKPYALSFFPTGEGKAVKPAVTLSDDVIQLSAFKQQSGGEAFIVRLFEPTGTGRSTRVTLPLHGIDEEIIFGPFEVKTFRVEPDQRRLIPVNLVERPE